MQDRIAVLKEFLKEEPGDAFTLYALALEYIKINAGAEADSIFSRLLEEHRDYLPSYYHAAKLKETLDQKDQAESIYRKGILLAADKKNMLALRELKAALDELIFQAS